MNTKTSTPAAPASPITPAAASRIQGATAKGNGGGVAKGIHEACSRIRVAIGLAHDLQKVVHGLVAFDFALCQGLHAVHERIPLGNGNAKLPLNQLGVVGVAVVARVPSQEVASRM